MDGGIEAGESSDVANDGDRHVGEPDEVAEALKGLEQDQQRQAWAGVPRALTHEGEFSRIRREDIQFGRARFGR